MAYYMVPITTSLQLFNNSAQLLAGGKVYTYEGGTTTPITTYSDSSGGSANANPIVLDAYGRLPGGVWALEGNTVKVVIQDASSNTLATIDNMALVNDISSSFASPPAIGTTMANAGTFTDLTTSGTVTSNGPLVLNGTTTFNSTVTFNSAQTYGADDGTEALPSIYHTGDKNTGIYFPANDNISITNYGYERLRINGQNIYWKGAFVDAVAGDILAAKIWFIRAWVKFVGSSGAISDQGNVSSVTDNGVGDWTINFTNPMPNDDYVACSIASPIGISGGTYAVAESNSSAPSTTAYRINCQSTGGVMHDGAYIRVAFISR